MTRPPKQSSFLSPERRKLFAALLEKEGLAAAAPPPIPRRDERADLPLSFAQQRLWFIHQLDPGSSAYNLSLAVRLEGPLDRAALEAALDAIVARHEALRTRFPSVDAQPVQLIMPALRLALQQIDLGTTPADEREAQAQQLANHEARQPFDLGAGPLVRATLLRLADDEHILLITMHHIVSDGWSLGIFVRELTSLYESYAHSATDPATSLPPLPIQYADWALWQRDDLQGSQLERQLSYWTAQLAGASPVLTLPTDHPRPPVQSFAGASQSFVLGPALTTALHELSRQAGATLFMTLLAGWQTLLYRYSGQDDIVVSTGIANRSRPETEPLIGCLINILLLRTRLAGDPSFGDVLSQTRRVVLEAQAHQDLPFEKLVEALQPVRDPSYSPLAQVMFVLHNAPAADPQIAGLRLRAVTPERVAAQYDLALHVTELPDSLSGTLEYNTQLFEHATISRMIGHLETLLTAIVAQPERRIDRLPLLTTGELQQMLLDWNATATAFPADRCLHQLFEDQAARQPDAPAAICDGATLSYAELNRRANQLAHHLQRHGVGPNVLVGLCMERSLDLVVGLLSIAKAGGAYVPLDPAYPVERLQFMISDTRAPVLLTQRRLADRLPRDAARIVLIDADWPTIERGSAEQPPSAVTPRDLVYVIYTSGSTGRPKAVLLDHRGRVNNFCDFNRRFNIGPGDRVLALSSPSFDMSAYDVFGTLAAGGTIVLPAAHRERDPAHWAELIERHAVTIWHSAPALLELLLAAVAGRGGLSQSLRLTLLGGDWIPVSLPDRLRALVPAVTVISLGGATEVSMDSTIYQIGRADPSWRSIPYGRPMANQRCYILDRNGEPLPVGIPGELHLGGIGVAWGYLNNPDLTAAKFIPDPFAEQRTESTEQSEGTKEQRNNDSSLRLYKTGDLARYGADGEIELLGRIDYQVKLHGLRIELGEIEAALREHPGISEGVVVARDMPGGEKRLVAYVVGAERVPSGQTESAEQSQARTSCSLFSVVCSPAELRDFLQAKLPDYMIPAAFVVLPALPLTPNGKVDRKALPVPTIERAEAGARYVAPRNEQEREIATVWSEVLQVARVGIHDNFFELGGDSFKAIRVLQRLDRRVALVELFRSPTIAELAGSLVAGRPAQPQQLLQRLSKPGAGPTTAVVCVPYGGGNAIVYQPLADALPARYALYAVALPGHDFGREDEPLQSIETLAPAIVAEIRATLDGPLILYGHCAGVALTIEVARLLEAADVPISAIVLGGSLPGSRRSRTRSYLARLLPARRMPSDERVFAYLQRLGGFEEIGDADGLRFVMRGGGHDSRVAAQYFERILEADAAPQLRAPIVCLIGESDPLTPNYRQRFKEWYSFSRSVRLVVIQGGNHYFIRHQADQVARAIAELPDASSGSTER